MMISLTDIRQSLACKSATMACGLLLAASCFVSGPLQAATQEEEWTLYAGKRDFYSEVKLGIMAVGFELGMRDDNGLSYVYVAETEGLPILGSWVNHLFGVKVPLNEHWFYRPTIGLHQDRPWNRKPEFEPAASCVVGFQWQRSNYRLGFDLLGVLLRYEHETSTVVPFLHVPKFKIAYDF